MEWSTKPDKGLGSVIHIVCHAVQDQKSAQGKPAPGPALQDTCWQHSDCYKENTRNSFAESFHGLFGRDSSALCWESCSYPPRKDCRCPRPELRPPTGPPLCTQLLAPRTSLSNAPDSTCVGGEPRSSSAGCWEHPDTVLLRDRNVWGKGGAACLPQHCVSCSSFQARGPYKKHICFWQ